MTAQAAIQPGTPDVFMAISDVMGIMSKEGIGKGRRNTQQGYQFRGIDDVYNALSSVLAERKLVMLPFVVEMRREERQTAKGGALNYTILTVDFTIVSAMDASQCVVRTIGEAMDSADKSSNKAQSAALKYAALQVFMIPTEGDNDADATTHEVEARPGQNFQQRAPREAAKQSAPADGMPDATYSELVSTMNAAGVTPAEVCQRYDIANVRQLSRIQYEDAMNQLKDKLAAKARKQTNQRANRNDFAGADMAGVNL